MDKMPTDSLGKSSELKLHCFCLFDAYSMPKNMCSVGSVGKQIFLYTFGSFRAEPQNPQFGRSLLHSVLSIYIFAFVIVSRNYA